MFNRVMLAKQCWQLQHDRRFLIAKIFKENIIEGLSFQKQRLALIFPLYGEV